MHRSLLHGLWGIVLLFASFASALAQTTPAGTVISNTATATYQDGAGSNYTAVSNTVSITVASVGGLVITPDASVSGNMAPNEKRVLPFTATNTSNFAQGIVFPASGGGVVVTGPVTVTRAVIDVNGNGAIDAGDTDIKSNGSAVTSANIAANGTLPILVEIQVNSNATAGTAVSVSLGDTTTGGPGFDDQSANSSANEVRTSDATAVNGAREAKGSYTLTTELDAQIQITLTAPSGPLTPGADIPYSMQACNNGGRAANAITLTAPAGSNSSVFLIAPIPVNTALKAGQTFPVGTLYSVDPLTTAPTAATWTTTAPATLSTVKRIAFPHGATLAVGGCTASYPFTVTIDPGTNPTTTPTINEIVDVFATSSLGSTITDQSGDIVPNIGDGNANFDEGDPPGSTDGNGIQQKTTLAGSPELVMGPRGNPTSTQSGNYASNCMHYSASIWPTADFNSITGTYLLVAPKTLSNSGSLPLSFGLIMGHKIQDEGLASRNPLTTLAATFTDTATDIIAEVSFDNGATWKVLNSANSLPSATSNLTANATAMQAPFNNLVIGPGQSLDFLVRYQIPAARLTGRNNLYLSIYSGNYFAGTSTPLFGNGYTGTTTPAVINSTPTGGNCPLNEVFESTADILVGNSVEVLKSSSIQNTTGTGAATDPVPGAEITYTLTIKGQPQGSTPATYPYGDGASQWGVPGSTLVITENGNTAPNNWGATTSQVVGSATCSIPATITGDSAGSTSLTFSITNPVQPGSTATCTFRRKIN